MATESELIDMIDVYCKQKNNRYAVLVYGEWGCGKTRFIRERLKDHLEKQSVPVVRASAFGVKSGDELMNRIISAFVNDKAGIEDNAKSRGEALKTILKKTGLSSLSSLFSGSMRKAGINYSVSPAIMIPLLLSKECLLVIDDLERCCIDDVELFGTINDLVESSGMHVVLVARDVTDISPELTEKLIWKKYEFTPDPAELINSIMGAGVDDMGSCAALDLIIEALRPQKVINARALLKIKPLLQQVCSTRFFSSEDFDVLIRHNVLSDVVSVAYEASKMGGIAKEVTREDESSGWPKDTHSNVRYEKYRDLHFIGQYLNGAGQLSVESVEAALSNFANKYHPQSSKEAAAIAAADRVKFWEFEDEEGLAAFLSIRDALAAREVSLSNIPRCIRAVKSLVNCGLVEEGDLESVISYSKSILLTSTLLSVRDFNSGSWYEWHTADGPSELYVPEIDSLRTEVEQAHAESAINMIFEGADCPSEDSGLVLADNVRKLTPYDSCVVTKVDPIDLSRIIAMCNVVSLQRIRCVIADLSKVRLGGVRPPECSEWMRGLENALGELQVSSKTRMLHIGYMKNDLCGYLGDQDTSC